MYSRKVGGETLSFEHARFLHERSFVMFDRKTVSLWIHTTGEAVVGVYKGKALEFLPSTVTTWGHWKKEHPKVLVLDVKKGKNPRFNLREKLESGGISVGQPGEELKLYPLPVLQSQRVVNDSVGGKPIVAVFDPDSFAFHAFERGELKFSIDADADGAFVDQSGTKWDLYTGTSGERSLEPVPAVPWLIEAWKRFYPKGQIFLAE